MRTRARTIAIAMLLTVVAPAAVGRVFTARLAQQPEIRASGAWLAEPAAGSTTASVYLDVSNPTMYDIYLVSGESEVAGKVEFRDTTGSEPKPVKEVTVPAYGATNLKPAGTTVVLMDLKRPLKAGEKIPLTLTTDGNLLLKVEAEVRKPQP